MEPVICYVLCNPSPKQSLDYLKMVFVDTFIKKMNDSTKGLKLAFGYIPFMQV